MFAILSERQLADVASHADEVEVEAGRTLMDEGAFGYEFFAVEDGTAEVTRDGAHVADLGPGDIFGEIALLEAPRRTATVRATTPMRLVVMHRRDFRALADRSRPWPTACARSSASARHRAHAATPSPRRPGSGCRRPRAG